MHALIRPPKGRGGPKPVFPGARAESFDRHWTRCICVASGPSFSIEQARLLAAAPGWHVIVTNNSWERVPTADILYAADHSWWEVHLASVLTGFRGECWTPNRRIAHRNGLHLVKISDEPGLTTRPDTVFSGANSGYQSINLAYLLGAREILLVGYDMQPTGGFTHWHGNHVLPLNQDLPFEEWLRRFPPLAADLAAQGVRVVNCTIETALTCFERGDLVTCLST